MTAWPKWLLKFLWNIGFSHVCPDCLNSGGEYQLFRGVHVWKHCRTCHDRDQEWMRKNL